MTDKPRSCSLHTQSKPQLVQVPQSNPQLSRHSGLQVYSSVCHRLTIHPHTTHVALMLLSNWKGPRLMMMEYDFRERGWYTRSNFYLFLMTSTSLNSKLPNSCKVNTQTSLSQAGAPNLYPFQSNYDHRQVSAINTRHSSFSKTMSLFCAKYE